MAEKNLFPKVSPKFASASKNFLANRLSTFENRGFSEIFNEHFINITNILDLKPLSFLLLVAFPKNY